MRFPYTLYVNSGGKCQPNSSIVDIEGFSPEDAIPDVIRFTRTFYENDLLQFIGACTPPGGVYLDVGANVGNHTVFFGKFLADHVIAVEPHPSLVPFLKRNLMVNGISNSTVIQCAVSDGPGIGRMILPERHKQNIGGSRCELLDSS